MIQVKNFDYGNLNVLIHSYNDLAKDINLSKVAQYNNINLFSIVNLRNTIFKNTIFYNMEWSEENIEKYNNHSIIASLYKKIESIVIQEKIKILIWLGDPGILSEDFLNRIKRYCYVSFWTFDDPVNSEKIVKHCAKYYYFGFTATVNWDKNVKTSEVFKKWGCPNANFIPMGVFEGKYKETSNFDKRKYDLIFIGSVFRKRLIFMFKLKKYFGNRMLIFGGGWNGENSKWYKKIILLILKWYYNVPKIDKISNDELIYYYQNSKIGINTHMTVGGPSAMRTYELPANGVMQICDSENGLKEIFEIGKEVASFKNNDAKDAIKKIEYYLENESERITIAKAGYEKTHNQYMVWHSFEKILKLIKKDEKFSRYIN